MTQARGCAASNPCNGRRWPGDAIHAGMSLTKDWPKADFRPRTDLYKNGEAEFVEHLNRLKATLARCNEAAPWLVRVCVARSRTARMASSSRPASRMTMTS